MGEESFYLLTIEAKSKNDLDGILQNARGLGQVKKIMSNVYVLTISVTKLLHINVRDIVIKGHEDGTSIMVARLDSNFASAWKLEKENVDYLRTIFDKIYGKDEE